MAFFIRSYNQAPLTFDREQENLTRAIPTGIFTGLQVYQGTAATWKVSLFGGTYCINGIVVYDDSDHVDLFDLGDPGVLDVHHLIYVTYDPDVDTEPQYQTKSGQFGGPATLTPSESANGFVIADVWLINTASDISDAVISNQPKVSTEAEITKLLGNKREVTIKSMQVYKSGNDYTFHFDEMNITGFSANKGVDHSPLVIPTVVQPIITATAGTVYTGPDGYEIEETASGGWIALYTIDPSDGSESTPGGQEAFVFHWRESGSGIGMDQLAELLGNDDGAFAGSDKYPYRNDFKNITILAIIDTANETVQLANGVIMPLEKEFTDGSYGQYVQTLTSTVYGSGPNDPVAGNIDLDSVITNMAVLEAATLDNVYDSFDSGSADGAGRIIDVDAGPVRLEHSGLVGTGDAVPDGGSNPFVSSMNIHMDVDDDNHALYSSFERGVDVVSKQQSSQRLGLSFRRPFYDSTNTDLLLDASVDLTDVGDQVQVSFTSGLTTAEWITMHGEVTAFAESRFVTFASITGNANDKAYRLRVNVPGTYFYLEATDGTNDDITLTWPNDFTALPESGTMSVWEEVTVLGEQSIVQNLEIQGDLRGPGGTSLIVDDVELRGDIRGTDGTSVIIDDFILGGSDSYIGEFIDRTTDDDVLGFLLNEGFQGDEHFSGIGSYVSPVTTQNSGITSDGRRQYIYSVAGDLSNPSEVEVYDVNGITSSFTITTDSNGAIDCMAANMGKLVICMTDTVAGSGWYEVWDVESNTLDVSVSYDVGSRILGVEVTQDRVWVCGQYTGVYNVKTTKLDGSVSKTMNALSGVSILKISAYGNHICIQSSGIAAIGNYSTTLDLGTFTSIKSFTDAGVDIKNHALNSKWFVVITEDGANNYLYGWSTRAGTMTAANADWEYDFGINMGYGSVVVDEEFAYALWSNGAGGSQMNCFNLETGGEVWRQDHPSQSVIHMGGTDLVYTWGFDIDASQIKRWHTGRRGGLWRRFKSNNQNVAYPYWVMPEGGF